MLLIMRDEPGVAEDLNIRDSAIADVRIVYHSRTTRVSTPKWSRRHERGDDQHGSLSAR
jgi:hypothetical protein